MMSLTPLTKASEERIIDAARDITGYVEGDGMSPEDAVIKVAREYSFGPPLVELLVNAYNTGRAAYQRKSASTLLDKMADFPIVRVESVISRLFPENQYLANKEAAAPRVLPSDEYHSPPLPVPDHFREQVRQKTAAAKLGDPVSQEEAYADSPEYVEFMATKAAEAAYDEVRSLERLIKEAQLVALEAQEYLAEAMGKLSGYFNRPAAYRLPLADVEWVAQDRYGDKAAPLFDYVQLLQPDRPTKEARAGKEPPGLLAVDWDAPPFSLVKAAMEQNDLADYAQLSSETIKRDLTAKIAEILAPFAPAVPRKEHPIFGMAGPEADSQPSSASAKQAGFFSGMLGGMGSQLARGYQSQMGSPDSETARLEAELSDPDHLDSLRKVQVQATLRNLMNDPDISGSDPDDVMEAYNELASLSPSAATNVAVMRPLLRARLARGTLEPFETSQLAELEGSLTTPSNVPPTPMPKAGLFSGPSILNG